MHEPLEPGLAEAILARLPIASEDPRVSCVFLGGSLAEGLGNPRSDVDVYVVVNALEGFSSEKVRWQHLRLDDRILAPVVVEVGALEAACRRVQERDRILDPDELDLLHRTRSGVALRHAAAFEEWRSRIPVTSLGRYLLRTAQAVRKNLFSDVVGASEAGDWETAALNSRVLVEICMDALLAAAGDTLPREKWRFRRIARTFGATSPLARWFLELECRLDLSTPEAMHAYVEATLVFHQFAESHLCWIELMGAAPEACSEGCAPVADAPRRNPFLRAELVEGPQLVLVDRLPRYRLDFLHALLWLSVDGRRGCEQLIARVLAAYGSSPSTLENAARALAASLHEWRELGWIR